MEVRDEQSLDLVFQVGNKINDRNSGSEGQFELRDIISVPSLGSRKRNLTDSVLFGFWPVSRNVVVHLLNLFPRSIPPNSLAIKVAVDMWTVDATHEKVAE